jgi:hypothetical protein
VGPRAGLDTAVKRKMEKFPAPSGTGTPDQPACSPAVFLYQVKLSLCLITHQALKAYKGLEINVHTLLITGISAA